MKNLNKAQAYKELIDEVKSTYKQRTIDKKVGLEWCDNCREINLWTYWQGFDYAEKTPDIKIMVVGQDFGSAKGTDSPANNIYEINTHGETKQYLADLSDKEIAITDKNLTELFEEVLERDIHNKRYDDLFFTNFSLGYRLGKGSGGMTLEMMLEDKTFFKKLCDIICPEKIICLGQITYQAVVKALTDKDIKINGYNKLLTECKPEVAQLPDKECKIYASAHTGYYGMLNRNKFLTRQGRMRLVINDWKKIFGKPVDEAEKALLCFESEWENNGPCRNSGEVTTYKMTISSTANSLILKQSSRNIPDLATFLFKIDSKKLHDTLLELDKYTSAWKDSYEQRILDGYHWKVTLSYDDGTQRVIEGVSGSNPDNANDVEKIFDDLISKYKIEYYIF